MNREKVTNLKFTETRNISEPTGRRQRHQICAPWFSARHVDHRQYGISASVRKQIWQQLAGSHCKFDYRYTSIIFYNHMSYVLSIMYNCYIYIYTYMYNNNQQYTYVCHVCICRTAQHMTAGFPFPCHAVSAWLPSSSSSIRPSPLSSKIEAKRLHLSWTPWPQVNPKEMPWKKDGSGEKGIEKLGWFHVEGGNRTFLRTSV